MAEKKNNNRKITVRFNIMWFWSIIALLIIGTCNYFAIAFPSGSGEAAVTFAAAGYNPVKVLKFTGPYCLIAIVSCGIMAQIMYPLY